MAVTYPLDIPDTIGIESIELRAINAVATSQSPFTYKQQIISHQGQRWEASVSIPTVRRDLAAEWKAFLTALKGPTGTFLLGDPDYKKPRGDVAVGSCSISGSAGDESVSVTMTGTLKAGDYIQLGTGSNSRLHQVLQDQTGNGTLEIWPKLRKNYSNEPARHGQDDGFYPKGLFRLKNNTQSWQIDSSSFYSISFECVEVIT